jgi:MFS family permease
LVMLAPLIGGAISPAISGAIAQTLGWREILYIASGIAVLCEVLFLTCFRETYKMAVLRRRVKRIQQESGEFENMKVTTKHESVLKLWHAIQRPVTVLFGSRVLMLISLFAAVSFSYFYVICISLPQVLQDVYDFTPAQAGSAFMAFSKSFLFHANFHR